MTVIGNKELTWDKDNDLIYQERTIVSLVPHEIHPKMWHLKFCWRDEKTPEFFNIFNARENARRFALSHLNQKAQENPTEARG